MFKHILRHFLSRQKLGVCSCNMHRNVLNEFPEIISPRDKVCLTVHFDYCTNLAHMNI